MSLGYLVISPGFSRQVLLTPSLAVAAARAGASAVIDGERANDADILQAFGILTRAAASATIGVRLRPEQAILATQLAALKTADQRLLAVITAGVEKSFVQQSLKSAISTLTAAGFEAIVECIDLAEAKLAESLKASSVIVKGNEAGGRVSDTTSFVLAQQVVRELSLPVYVQGGIGLHSAAAMAIAGAAGVVLDAQLYLCRDSQIAPELRGTIERMDGTSAEPALSIGADGCFAARLAEIGGTVSGVIDAIKDSVAEHVAAAGTAPILGEGAPLATSHGTRFPIVQGAMTRVSDTAEFARAVAQGGALPFLALSLMRGADIEALLKATSEQLGTLPWGVGLLGFVPTQLRQEQLEVVNRYKPPFALIAGGRPDQAKSMEDAGTATYLHVPSPLLLKSFIEMGSRRFIFEGKECGGHVGPRSSMILWDEMIAVLLDAVGPRDNPQSFHVLFAGGIHDDLSAAMTAAMAAPLAARGIKVGVLVGTAYLFTKEAVETGAIVPKFQDEALKCDKTVLLETGPGHSIRCIASPYKEAFEAQRKELEQQNKSRDEVREELELMNLGRLRIASKGVVRGSKGRELVELPADQQWNEGMYMIGQVAALRDKQVSIEELHVNIGNDGHKLLQQQPRIESVSEEAQEPSEPIAIVGMSCLYPKANDIETYWQNILNKVDAITEIPETHFDWKNYYDKDPLAKDKIVSKWGGFLEDIVFDPSRYGIPPSSLDSIDPMQVLILEAARTALHDAGYTQRKYPRDKTSVILANAGHGPITALYSLRSMLGWKLSDLDEETREKIADAMPEWTEDSFAGYLGNVTAGRVANRFDFKGINFSIDAACASSLAALYVGVSDLRSGASDIVLLGATDTHNQPGDYLSFSKTHALSATGRCKTFDASADGIAISEGVAMLVLKRLSDAERAGDRIYAVIRGIGGSSDGRDLSLTAPRPAGQMLALNRAYEDAAINPSTVELIEAHGTGTVAGDKAEVEALTRVFEQAGAAPQSCAIGSVKTNIGHSKAAAGLASIVKIAKALHHKVLPPTINVQNPNPACRFGEGPFYLSSESRPWIQNGSTPRRAGVSAFGFGGTNFHTVLEEYIPPCTIQESPAVAAWPTELFVWKARSLEQLLKAVSQTEALLQKQSSGGAQSEATSLERKKLFNLAYKLSLKASEVSGESCAVLAVVADSFVTLQEKLRQVKERIEKSAEPFGVPGMHFSPALKPVPVAFLFPGQGSQRVGMLKDLTLYFPELRHTIEQVDKATAGAFDRALSKFFLPTPALSDEARKQQQKELTDTQIAQPAIGAASLAMLRLLENLGAQPNVVAGHSYGEYTALHAAQVISQEDLLRLSIERGRILADCAKNNPGSMAAVSCDIETAKEVIASIDNVYVANFNSPQQCIISGGTEALEQALAAFKKRDIACTKIPVSAAFHTPLMKDSRAPLSKALRATTFNKPQVPVWSNTTAEAHEIDGNAIADRLEEHALQPVLFAQQIRNMHKSGIKLFVEVGPGNVLTGLTEATLRGSDFVAVNTEASGKNPLAGFLNTLAVLLVNGVSIDTRKLFWARAHELALPAESSEPAKTKLLYRVNSVRMERIGNNGGKPQAQANNTQKPATTAATPVAPPKAAPAQVNGNVTNGQPKRLAPQPVAPAPLTTPISPLRASRPTDSSVERVMLDFQQSMLQMTNRFLETQQNVMLAYLQANGKMPVNQLNQFMASGVAAPTSVEQTIQHPVVQAQPLYTNGNGNGHSEYNGHAPLNGQNGNHTNGAQPQQILNAIVQNQQSREDAQSETAVASAEPAEPAEDANALDKDGLVESLYEIVSDRTGYPREMLDPTLDLEADLGIDSIKRVEILNNFRKLLPESVQEQLESGIEKLAGTKTLQGVIDWIQSLDVDVAAGSSGAGSAGGTAQSASKIERQGDAARVARGLVTARPLSAPTTTKQSLEKAIVVVSPAVDADKLRKQLKNAAIEVVAGTTPVEYFKLAKQSEQELRGKATADKRTAWINVTKLGGNFAITEQSEVSLNSLVDQAASIGLTKTIAKEWTEVHVKALDFEAKATEAAIAKAILAELNADDSIVEVGFKNGERLTLDIAEMPYTELRNAPAPIDSNSVVLVTGGARGITAEIALDVAKKYQPTFVIVGRLPRPAGQEQAATAGLESAKDIKAALIEQAKAAGQAVNIREIEKSFQQLLREREVRKTLTELEATGSRVKYYAVDVSDEEAFGKLIDSVYETATIDGVIHGAGIIEDGLIKDKTPESFARVFNTKIKSALTLAEHLRFDELKFLYFFSSVVGRTGNAGQADYVSANEALNKLAVALNSKSTARVASLMWGPWQAGMAPPELEEVFARHGWSMIQPEDGRACFAEELIKTCPEQAEVLLVGKLAEKPENAKASGALLNTAQVENGDKTTFAVSVHTRDHLYLEDHKFDGIPVMPMAVALEMMLEAGQALYPDRQIVSVSNMDIPAGIVFHSPKKDLLIDAAADKQRDGLVNLVLNSTGTMLKPHFRCKAEFATAPQAIPDRYLTSLGNEIATIFDAASLPASEARLPAPKDIYGTWLFHGPIFQGISSIASLHSKGICGEVSGCRPERFVTFADGSDWILDPALLDSAMQLAGIWARHDKDVTVLPAGFKTMRFFRQLGSGKVTAQVFLTQALASELLCDLAIYDQDGKIALVIEGLAGIASKAFNRFSSQAPVKELV